MNLTVITGFSVVLMALGGLVSILFWLPGLVDKKNLKEFLGNRYWYVYVIYSANGPFLFLLGLLLFITAGKGG